MAIANVAATFLACEASFPNALNAPPTTFAAGASSAPVAVASLSVDS